MVDEKSVIHPTVWGRGVLVGDVAIAAGTIPYQLFCNVRRVPLIYSET